MSSSTYSLPEVSVGTRVGVFGGSFDPPHLGHAFLCLSVLMATDVDEIWVLPCADHAFKSDLEKFEKRMDMCRDTFGHINGAEVVGIEQNLEQPSYTADTLEYIRSERPDIHLYFIIGGDLVEEVPDWSYAEELTDFAKFLIVPRHGYPIIDIPDELGDPVILSLNIDLPELSSTLISKLQSRGVSVEGFVERRVYEKLSK